MNLERHVLTQRVLIGLAAGLGAGLALRGTDAADALVPWLDPIGTLWISAIRMTILPLVVSLLIVLGLAIAPVGVLASACPSKASRC